MADWLAYVVLRHSEAPAVAVCAQASSSANKSAPRTRADVTPCNRQSGEYAATRRKQNQPLSEKFV